MTVFCPDRERSATGHGLTLHKPIRAEPVTGIFHDDIDAWACSGTPADCVKLALGAVLEVPPDFVLSGINHGANLGSDVLYSGTVSAAMEGVIEGISAIALSLASFSCQDFQPAANVALRLVKQLHHMPLPQAMLFNVNVPPLAEAQIKGVILARQGIRRYVDLFEKRVDPRGKTYYWLAGEVLSEVDQDLGMLPPWPTDLTSLPTDVQVINQRGISVTPLQYDLTAYGQLSGLKAWLTEL